MAYNIELRTRSIAGEVNIFDSTQVRWVTGGVTIDHTTVTADSEGRKVLGIGTPLGKITATGKYGPYNKDATDGRQTAVCMLGETVNFELDGSGKFGDQVATAFDWARVIEDRLPMAVDATVKEQLKNITFV